MKKFMVTLSRTFEEQCMLDIEAETEDEARQIAEEGLSDSAYDGEDWIQQGIEYQSILDVKEVE